MVNFSTTITALFSSCLSRNQSSESRASKARGQEKEDIAEPAVRSGNESCRFRLRGLFSKPNWEALPSSRVRCDATNAHFKGDPPLSAKLSTETKDGKANLSLSEEEDTCYNSKHESVGHVDDLTFDAVANESLSTPLRYYESETKNNGCSKPGKSTLRKSTGSLGGRELLYNVVERLKSAEKRADTMERFLLEQSEICETLKEKNNCVLALEKKLALFECAILDNAKLDEIANDLFTEQARVRELESINQNLERRLSKLKIASTNEIMSIGSKLQSKSQLLDGATVRLHEAESALQEARTELAQLKKTHAIVQERSSFATV